MSSMECAAALVALQQIGMVSQSQGWPCRTHLAQSTAPGTAAECSGTSLSFRGEC
jgi:hypothetical protein